VNPPFTGDLRRWGAQVMDGYQWVLAAAAHTERHAKQMLEVIAEDTFPVG